MAGRKNIYQQYGAMPNANQGGSIWERHDAFMTKAIPVYCRLCGKEMLAPAREDSKSMEHYEQELHMQVHSACLEKHRRGE